MGELIFLVLDALNVSFGGEIIPVRKLPNSLFTLRRLKLRVAEDFPVSLSAKFARAICRYAVTSRKTIADQFGCEVFSVRSFNERVVSVRICRHRGLCAYEYEL